MYSRLSEVHAFFDTPDRYLKRGCNNIKVRSVIVKELLGSVSDARILDLGCGDGSISMQLLADAKRVTMVDLSAAMLERAKNNTPAEYKSRVDYKNIDFLDLDASGEYDVVLCLGLLAHVDSVERAIEAAAEFLKPKGQYVLQLTDHDQLVRRLLDEYHAARALCINGVRWLRNKPALSRGYPLNLTRLSQVLALARCHGLRPVAVRRHALQLPGMGKLPKTWLLRYDLYVSKSRVLSAHGCEAIILFEKEG
jgi:ubiquinone/menaquinone biosynthesis C-methylase UbiE